MEFSDVPARTSSPAAEHSLTASQWLSRLNQPDEGTRGRLNAAYGTDAGVLEGRTALLRSVLETFMARYGDRAVRVFRSPGRINLRGMHVDSHGGYLNLMTHQREAVIAAAPRSDDTVTVANTDPTFEEVSFQIGQETARASFAGEWIHFILDPGAREAVISQKGHWGRYMQGCAFSAQHRVGQEPLRGMQAVAGSDIPRGAALSSSAALCTAGVLAMLGLNGHALSPDDLILAARDAEWYTGSRCGVSDQAAMVLGGMGELVNVALQASRFDSSGATRIPFPGDLRVLVINSHTERSISGAQLVEYTRNRFAYSMAIEIFRQDLAALGFPKSAVAEIDGLPGLAPYSLEQAGGAGILYDVLLRIPEQLSLEDLARRYDLPDLTASYEEYFGSAPPELRPTSIELRGPLVYGIAESERARLFIGALQRNDYAEAGHLMSLGHDGDRRISPDGAAHDCCVSDRAIQDLRTAKQAIEHCSGVYGASTPSLDALVDAAHAGGALGASLTGAGLAGTVLALCKPESVEGVTEAVRARLRARDYASLAGLEGSLTEGQLSDSVLLNTATAAAGELAI